MKRTWWEIVKMKTASYLEGYKKYTTGLVLLLRSFHFPILGCSLFKYFSLDWAINDTEVESSNWELFHWVPHGVHTFLYKVNYYNFVLLWASYGDVQQIVVACRSQSSRVERHGESDFPTFSVCRGISRYEKSRRWWKYHV